MRYLPLLMLLFPTIVSANYSEIPNRYGGRKFRLFNNKGVVI